MIEGGIVLFTKVLQFRMVFEFLNTKPIIPLNIGGFWLTGIATVISVFLLIKGDIYRTKR